MTAPKPLTEWQETVTPTTLPRHIRRNIAAGPDGCWLWTRSLDPDGYGWASLHNRTHQAHRLVYVLVVGPVPDGLVLDHLCRVRHCVNPEHLEPVSNAENLRRGNTPGGWLCCQRCGSDFVIIGKTAQQRRCPVCARATEQARRAA